TVARNLITWPQLRTILEYAFSWVPARGAKIPRCCNKGGKSRRALGNEGSFLLRLGSGFLMRVRGAAPSEDEEPHWLLQGFEGQIPLFHKYLVSIS
uniref:Uncharacterized protein n=1 Tax=Mustela putorius furo TaxID=9669 RepID=M3Z0Q8_MUSPF